MNMITDEHGRVYKKYKGLHEFTPRVGDWYYWDFMGVKFRKVVKITKSDYGNGDDFYSEPNGGAGRLAVSDSNIQHLAWYRPKKTIIIKS